MYGNNTKIALYSYPYLKLAKIPCFSIFYVFSLTKLENKRVEQVLPGHKGGGERGGGPNNVYTCK
jgi:hypothetical protein